MAKRKPKADAGPVLPGMESAALPSLGPVKPLARATAKPSARRAGGTPSPWPWDCVVLAVDTAATSGWAIGHAGELLGSGEVNTLDAVAVRHVVEKAVMMAALARVPCVLVLEAPWGGSPQVVAALGRAQERWLAAWRELAVGNQGKVVKPTPSEWRAPVLGGLYAGATREQCRLREQGVARYITGKDSVGSDEAPAICIWEWGSHAMDVGVLIGKRAVKRTFAGGVK